LILIANLFHKNFLFFGFNHLPGYYKILIFRWSDSNFVINQSIFFMGLWFASKSIIYFFCCFHTIYNTLVNVLFYVRKYFLTYYNIFLTTLLLQILNFKFFYFLSEKYFINCERSYNMGSGMFLYESRPLKSSIFLKFHFLINAEISSRISGITLTPFR